jgi:hypothetical protein
MASPSLSSASALAAAHMYMDPRHPYANHHVAHHHVHAAQQQQQQLHARRIFQEWTLQFGPSRTAPGAPYLS